MPVILNTRSSVQAATKVLEKAFTNRAQKVPPLYKKFFNVISTDPKRSFATFLPYAEIGTLRYKPEGQAPTYDQPFELIPSTFNYFTFSLAAAITEEAQLEDPIGFLGKVPEMLADAEQVTKDLTFWNTLNLGFNTAVNGADGQPLFSTAHPLAPRSIPGQGVVSMIGATFSNSLGALQLSAEALQQAYILFETLLSDRGLPARRTPVYLLCGPQLAKVAEEILGTPYAPYTNQNQVNTARETVQLMVVRYITSPTFWCIAAAPGDIQGDSHSLVVGHKWENRVSSWMDPSTKNFNMATSFRSTYGFIGWRGIVGSQGA
jgi:hypothetical protein